MNMTEQEIQAYIDEVEQELGDSVEDREWFLKVKSDIEAHKQEILSGDIEITCCGCIDFNWCAIES
jgi:hypothetical protein